MRKIVFSAPGKVILAGEHAVVHRRPSIIFALPLRVSVTLQEEENSEDQKVLSFRKKVDHVISGSLGMTLPKYSVTIRSEIPTGVGLGSSAAVSAAYVGAIFTLMNIPLTGELLHQVVYACEKVFHGNPSGADTATVISGGLLWYKKNEKGKREFFNIQIPNKKMNLLKKLVLIYSGKPKETTKEMVEKVARFTKRYPSNAKSIFDNIERIVLSLHGDMQNLQSARVAQLLMECEKYLELLGVVGEKAKKIIRGVESVGGRAKISGAGGIKNGSGMILAFHDDPLILKRFIEDRGLTYFPASIESQGLRRELIDGK